MICLVTTEYFTTEFGLALAVMGVIIAFIFWRIGVPQEQAEAAAPPKAG
jgi:hypothetical protein